MHELEMKLKAALIECELLKKENEELRRQLNSLMGFQMHQAVINKNHVVRKQSPVEEKIRLFRDLFKGRSDVFALRFESKRGKSGYSPACLNEWHPTLCQKPKIKCATCPNRQFIPLSDQVIYNHLKGEHTVGLYPLLKDDTCWFLAVDFDKKNWERDATTFLEVCESFGVSASLERSRSGDGCHVWIFFNTAIPATLARQLGTGLLSNALEKYKTGTNSFDRFFPNQDTLPNGGFGNLIALPLQRNPAFSGNSVFVDRNFEPYPDQWLFLSSVHKMTINEVKGCISKFKKVGKGISTTVKNSSGSYPKLVKITIKNGIFISKDNLTPDLLNRLKQLGVISNPEYYKAQKMRRSTYNLSPIIDCTEDQPNYLILPRGCLASVKKLLNDLSINVEVKSEQFEGTPIEVNFTLQLTRKQLEAEASLFNSDIGILSAATGFGKTVVATSLIARRGINTLIIVHTKHLVEQWIDRLSVFYNIDRKSIGQIGGGKYKVTGFIDVATIQSLNYKGQVKDIVQKYGQIIVDECHHVSAFSFEKVLKAVHAKYFYGLTATTTRKDGLQPIIYMQLGPVRFKVTAKSQARIRPFEHVLIPRMTTFKSQLTEEQKKNNIQNLFEELTLSEGRNLLIFDDVLKAMDQGRSPIIITERVAHVDELKRRFNGFVKNIIVLIGGVSNKEEQRILNELRSVPENEERLIIATGKYIGEGFDDSRLDTLFLTYPLSWKGTLNQYIGRLHRLNDNKKVVQVYDYVDQKEPIFKDMFRKRLKEYKSMGYTTNENNGAQKNEQMKLF